MLTSDSTESAEVCHDLWRFIPFVFSFNNTNKISLFLVNSWG